MTSTCELTLSSHAYGGESFGRLADGRAVFVPFSLPGETVRVQLTEEKRGYARAELVEVLSPSPHRVIPRCPHFTQCGGCHYQHMDYASQLLAKQEILRDQLQRNAGIQDVPLRPIVPSPQAWNYRNHLQFHLTPEGKLGFSAARSNQVVAVGECHLPEPPLDTIWPQLDIEPVAGLERLGLRLGAGEDVQLILESSDPQPLDFLVEDLPLSAVHLGPGGCLVLAGSERLVMEVLGRPFYVSASSFFQVNTFMAAAMVEHVLGNIELNPGAVVLDVYCGVGLFSAFLAPLAGRLVGIEDSASACEDFAINLEEFDHVELYAATAEETLSSLDFQSDLILLDPPRSGLERGAMQGLLRQRARCLVYASCDPSTLGRDIRRLIQAGYRLQSITPFDLFPQTYHIESISFLELEAAP